jgi:nucleotide-binding universal stress UspA family protein
MSSHAEPSPAGPVVVGYDGSRDSAVALDWAAAEANELGAPLRVVMADHRSGMASAVGFTNVAMVPESFAGRSTQHSLEARRRAGGHLPDSSIETTVVNDRPAAALVAESERAGLIVVGHRGLGAVRSMLGSVSFTVAERARCPVVVVRGVVEPGTRPSRPVAVGVDGSSGSTAALAFAAETATRWGVPLRVVCAWAMVPEMGFEYGSWQAVSMMDWSELAKALSSSAQEAGEAAATLAEANRPGLVVEVDSPELQPALALEEVSRASSLLVVGGTDASAWGGLLLGSVSRSVLHQALCPVAVVKASSVETMAKAR